MVALSFFFIRNIEIYKYMNIINKQQLVELYKALSDPTRIEMVGFLLAE